MDSHSNSVSTFLDAALCLDGRGEEVWSYSMIDTVAACEFVCCLCPFHFPLSLVLAQKAVKGQLAPLEATLPWFVSREFIVGHLWDTTSFVDDCSVQ